MISARVESVDLLLLQRIADRLVDHLPAHTVIGLVGTLGAGKTALVQALARSAGIDATDVTSPTFTLLQTHRGRLTLHHLDTYRIADEDEFVELGVDELFADPTAWTLVEWADRVTAMMPPGTLWIEIKIDDDDRRRLTFKTDDEHLGAKLREAVAGIGE